MATVLYFPDARMAMSRFASGKNKNYDQLTSSVQDSFASFQKVSKSFSVSRIRTFCLLAAMCFPTANEKQLRVAAQWIITLFAWDDAFDDPEEGNLMDDASGASKINKLIVSVLDHPEISKTQAELPVVAAFRIFWTGFRASSTPAMQKRFANTVREYALAAVNLIHNREEKRSPGIDEFIAMRRGTSAVETCLALVDFCLEIEVPDEAFYNTTVQELHSIINDIASWTNDLYSFNKEQAAGDYQNLLAVIAIEKDLDVQSAIQLLFIKIQSAIDHYFEVKAHIPAFDAKTDELVSRYERGLECTCSGLVCWTFQTPRYFGSVVPEGIPVKMLPREKNALNPGVELNYNTPSIVGTSKGNEELSSKDAPHIALDPGFAVNHNTQSTVTASVGKGEATSEDVPHTLLDTGFKLQYNTPFIVGDSMENGESTFRDARHTASNGALLLGVH